MGLIITPNDEDFYTTLHTALPPGWQQSNGVDVSSTFVVRHDTGCLEAMSQQQLADYLWGGEYREVVDNEQSDPSC